MVRVPFHECFYSTAKRWRGAKHQATYQKPIETENEPSYCFSITQRPICSTESSVKVVIYSLVCDFGNLVYLRALTGQTIENEAALA